MPSWPIKDHSVTNLHLDPKNPRLGREATSFAPREIIQYLFEHDKAMDVAVSIATRGFFSNEPLLSVRENDKYIVVEGNRRLAALKALREPDLLEGQFERQIERLSRRINQDSIAMVPVTLAPNRRATDRLLAGRHIGTPVLAWQAENRASFILEKLAEGYTNNELLEDLGFSLADIQSARQTRAIADMARSLDLPDGIKAKIDSPRAKLFSTLERVFDSPVGREYMMVEPDSEHGLRGTTTKGEFLRAFTKLVTDVVKGNASSRRLNTTKNMRDYFEGWKPDERPTRKKGTFVPSELIKGKSIASPPSKPHPKVVKKNRQESLTVLPKNLKVLFGNDRLTDIRRELIRLKRSEYPNAGAVLLRVFFELTVIDYLNRTDALPDIVKKLETKYGRKLQYGVPKMNELIPEIIKIAKAKLSKPDAAKIEKAVTYHPSAPFTITDLHGFVHSSDLPSERDILQFWLRTEPLFRLMLEQAAEGTTE